MADENKVKKEENKNIVSGLSKKDIIEILNHDAFIETLQKFSGHNKWVQITKIGAFFLTAVLAIIGFYLAWQSNVQVNRAAEIRAYEEGQEKLLSDWMKYKITLWERGKNAVMDMRKMRELIVIRCQEGNPPSLSEQTRLRFLARFEVAKAFTGWKQVFGIPAYSTMQELTNFDESVPDVCAKGAPPDSVWQRYLYRADDLVGAAIQNDKSELERLNKESMLSKYQLNH